MRALQLLFFCFLTLVGGTASLRAQAPGLAEPTLHDDLNVGDPPAYVAAIGAGIEEFQHGRFMEARAHMLQAQRIFPNARVLRGLGKVEYELRNYGDSVRYLEEALESDVKPLDAKLREETSRLLARAKLYVGEVHVEVEPSSATVSVDGMTVARGPASLILQLGNHVLEFQANGRIPERRAVNVSSGEPIVLQVVLANESGPIAAPATAHADVDRSKRRRRWLWSAAGVTAAAAVVVIALTAYRDRTYRDDPPFATSATPPGTVLQGLQWR